MKKTVILIAVLFSGIMFLTGCAGIFDTGTYWYEMPPEKIMINGNMVHNPDYDEYVKIYGNNPDASKPKRVYPTN